MQRSKGFLVPGGGSTRAGRRDGVLLWVADELQLHGEEREPAAVEVAVESRGVAASCSRRRPPPGRGGARGDSGRGRASGGSGRGRRRLGMTASDTQEPYFAGFEAPLSPVGLPHTAASIMRTELRRFTGLRQNPPRLHPYVCPLYVP